MADCNEGQCNECYYGAPLPDDEYEIGVDLADTDEIETIIQGYVDAGRTIKTLDTEKLDQMLKTQSLYLTIYPGDGFQYRNCYIAVIRVQYPFMVLEVVDIAYGNALNVTLEDTMCFKNAYLKVIKRKDNYIVVEFVGVKKGVAKAIQKAERIMEKKKWNNRAKKRKYRR
jgi:hypothetical protein